MVCVVFLMCGLVMVEFERYFFLLIIKIEDLLDEFGLKEEEIMICMIGCFNGCVRLVLVEIVFIGKVFGKYNMYLGGSFKGECLNKIYKENIDENEILESLCLLLLCYSKECFDGEYFGDFVICDGVIVKVYDGCDFYS